MPNTSDTLGLSESQGGRSVSADDNVKSIQAIYEAFGRGDVAAILDSVTDDVEWGADTASTAAPWYGIRHGKSEVESFFQQFGSNMEVQEFTPLDFASSDDSVMAVVRCRATSRSTGKPIDMNLHHYFRFRDGKIWFYRGTEDTAQTEAALRA